MMMIDEVNNNVVVTMVVCFNKAGSHLSSAMMSRSQPYHAGEQTLGNENVLEPIKLRHLRVWFSFSLFWSMQDLKSWMRWRGRYEKP